ncbi:MFS transporter [Nocardioides flavescens]|uniref:MFS transporter n=1 Tax=Nocardioides flavescens TaxID=2691959 RepID=A0A6L7F0M8_9ACTN|nr:MFS transporter [Nocardioides flavescens]
MADTGSGALAPLREPTFRWFFLAQLVNLAGSVMNSVALTFAVLAVDDSASALGTVLAAHSVPMVVFLLLGGVIADRFSRTLVIQVSNVAAGLTQLAIAALVLGGHATVWQLVALTAVNGVVSAASLPAFASLLPQLVSPGALQQANALVALQRSALRVVGPALAGVLVVTVGAGWAIAADGLTYLVSAALLLKVRLPPLVRDTDEPSLLTQLREGWGYVVGTTWLWVVVVAFGVLNALHAGLFFTLGPVIAQRTEIGEAGWGLALSAEALGLVLAGLVLLRVSLRRPLLWGMGAITLCAAPMITLGLTPHLPTLIVAMVLAGVSIEVFSIGWALAMQEHVPPPLLSRAYSYDMLGSFVAIPIGQLGAGVLAGAVGAQHALVGAGLLYVVVCLLTLCSRQVRDLPRVAPAAG